MVCTISICLSNAFERIAESNSIIHHIRAAVLGTCAKVSVVQDVRYIRTINGVVSLGGAKENVALATLFKVLFLKLLGILGAAGYTVDVSRSCIFAGNINIRIYC